jgi:hypothetical protein
VALAHGVSIEVGHHGNFDAKTYLPIAVGRQVTSIGEADVYKDIPPLISSRHTFRPRISFQAPQRHRQQTPPQLHSVTRAPD